MPTAYTSIATLALLATTTFAQPCTPSLIGAPTGPQGGLNGEPAVNAMACFDDAQGPALYVGGAFSLSAQSVSSSPLFVAKYQQGRWTAMTSAGVSGPVRSIAQADFSSVGGPNQSIYALSSTGISRWDGATWVTVGSFTASLQARGLLSLTDAQGPVLIAPGGNSTFANTVFAWRGSGLCTPYYALAVTGGIFNIKLEDDGTGAGPCVFALGDFSHPSLATDIIKLVEGQWTQYSVPHTSGFISDLTVHDDGSGHGREVYVAGRFQMFLNPVVQVARLREGIWEPVVAALAPPFDAGQNNGWLPRLINFNDGQRQRLFLSGPFDSGASAPQTHTGIIEVTANGWTTPLHLFRSPIVGSGGGMVTNMVRFDDGQGERTYISGIFSTFNSTYNTTTASRGYGLVRLEPDGTPESLARGLGDGAGFDPDARYDLAALDLPEGNRLIATGPISRAAGRFAGGAASFNGQQWSPLNIGLARSHSSQSPVLYSISGTPRLVAKINTPNAIAFWDGVSWTPLPSQPTGFFRKLAVLGNTLYAATSTGLHRFDGIAWTSTGNFTSVETLLAGDLGDGPKLYIGGVNASVAGVYSWDGATASRLGTLPASAASLGIHDAGSGPTLYAGADGRISNWNGMSWTPLPDVFVVPNTLSFASYDDGRGPALYISGSIRLHPTSTFRPGLYRYQNGACSPIFQDVSSSNPPVRAMSLAVFQNKLYLAGDFVSPAGLNADHLFVLEPCPRICTQDYNNDGDAGTDADIEAFFQCLAGNCCDLCTADFNNDGDTGTDADIESFFRVLAGGPC